MKQSPSFYDQPIRRYKLLPVMVVRHSGNFGGRWRPGVKYASSCQISPRSVKPLQRYRNLSISPRWRPSAILDLLDTCSDNARTVLVGLNRHAKFGCNRCSSFDNMAILIVHPFGLKTAIYAPKTGLWVTSEPPKWVIMLSSRARGTSLLGRAS